MFKKGDLVKMNPADIDPRGRKVGQAIRTSFWQGDCGNSRGPGDIIVEVLWNTGRVEWILASRVLKVAN